MLDGTKKNAVNWRGRRYTIKETQIFHMPSSLSVINWFRGHKKSYFTIMPTLLWNQFRNIPKFNYEDINIVICPDKKMSTGLLLQAANESFAK